MQLGWGRQIGRVNLNVNASRSSGNYDGKHEDRLYITAQLPLGDRGSISSYMNRNAGKDRYGVRLDQSLSRDRNWSLAVDRDNQRKTNAMTGTFSAVTPWTNLNGSASGDSDNYRSLSSSGQRWNGDSRTWYHNDALSGARHLWDCTSWE
ncbi:fimbria/pilus outer membrane usher protein [Apirhabdus apintestini]|nr:fimbria/pilus outer membrane usher protein [Enterobacteriaceae bacterium CA-0114]